MTETKLINEKITKKHPDQLFEQYKLFVESAQEISRRRENANHFYLAINTGLTVISGYLSQQPAIATQAIPLFGLSMCWYWRKTIKAYQKTNNGKFKIIHKLEDHLPAKPYNTEEYASLTQVEEKIPIVFGVLYLAILATANWVFISRIIA
ncbi:MAG: hypothetical protein HY392_03675 [Candidatus Diapherotrites archaeon]|nr:hypothetical protein [Candidatus Diapherotrites archaeon]